MSPSVAHWPAKAPARTAIALRPRQFNRALKVPSRIARAARSVRSVAHQIAARQNPHISPGLGIGGDAQATDTNDRAAFAAVPWVMKLQYDNPPSTMDITASANGTQPTDGRKACRDYVAGHPNGKPPTHKCLRHSIELVPPVAAPYDE